MSLTSSKQVISLFWNHGGAMPLRGGSTSLGDESGLNPETGDVEEGKEWVMGIPLFSTGKGLGLSGSCGSYQEDSGLFGFILCIILDKGGIGGIAYCRGASHLIKKALPRDRGHNSALEQNCRHVTFWVVAKRSVLGKPQYLNTFCRTVMFICHSSWENFLLSVSAVVLWHPGRLVADMRMDAPVPQSQCFGAKGMWSCTLLLVYIKHANNVVCQYLYGLVPNER